MESKDLPIIQGDTFEWLILINDVNGVPLDMTTFTGGTSGARGMIRKTYADAAPVVSFAVTILNKTGVLAAITAKTCHLTTADIAALALDTVGKCYLLVRLTAAATAGIAKGKYVYDLEIEDPTAFVFKPYGGNVVVASEATK